MRPTTDRPVALVLAPPTRQPDGRFGLEVPMADAPLAAVAAEDVGGAVARLFEWLDAYRSRTVPVAGDGRPVPEYLALLAPTLGAPVDYGFMSREAFADLPLRYAAKLADMFDYDRRYVPRRTAVMAGCRVLYTETRHFTARVAGHGRRHARARRPPASLEPALVSASRRPPFPEERSCAAPPPAT